MTALQLALGALRSQAWWLAPCAAMIAAARLREARRRWRQAALEGGDLPRWLLWWRRRRLMRGDVPRQGQALAQGEVLDVVRLEAAFADTAATEAVAGRAWAAECMMRESR